MRSALAKLPEIQDLETKPARSGGTATFKVAKGFDFQSSFDEAVAAGNEHLAGYKVVGS